MNFQLEDNGYLFKNSKYNLNSSGALALGSLPWMFTICLILRVP